MHSLYIPVSVILVLFFSAPSMADIYKYETDSGSVCFTDDLGTIPRKYRKKIITDDSAPSESVIVESKTKPTYQANNPAIASASSKRKPFDGTIMLYVRDRCPFGAKSEAYLKKIGSKYNRQDFTGEPPMFKTADGRYGSVVMVIGNKTIHGFSEGAINQAIENGGN